MSAARVWLGAIGIISAVAGCAGRTATEIREDGESPNAGSPGMDGSETSPADEVSGVGDATGAPRRDTAQTRTEVPACAADVLELPGYTNLAMYHFEETQGAKVLDTSGADGTIGDDGTLVGGRRTEGRCGRGVTFSADGAHLDLAAMGPQFDAGVAVSVWVRPASIGAGEAHIIGDGGGGLASFQLILDAGYPVFRIANSIGEWNELLRADAPLVAGVWQHVTLTYEPGSGNLSVDGNVLATTDIVQPIQGSYNTVAAGAIMNVSPCCSYHHQYLGDIDELAIFAR